MSQISDHIYARFVDVSDAVAFLTGEYGTTPGEVEERRRDELDHIIEAWCQQQCEDDDVAQVLAARARRSKGAPAPKAAPAKVRPSRTTPAADGGLACGL